MEILLVLIFTFCIILPPQGANAGLIVKAPPYIGLNEGLVGFWSFDGPDMSQSTNNVWALDRSGQGNNGVLKNMATSTARKAGKLGQALEFDAVNDYVNVGDPTAINTLAAFSISFWRNAATVTNGYVAWISAGWNVSFNSDRLYLFRYFSGLGMEALANANTALGKWDHYAVTTDGSATAVNTKLYKNGVLLTLTIANDGSGSLPDTSGAALQIGGNGNINQSVNALLDEVRVYNRALSGDEIKRLYKIGSTFVVNKTRQDTLREGLVGHWSFDGADMDGNRALDRSGQGNTGALTGGPKRVAGKIGQALDFDGSDDHVKTTTSVPFQAALQTKSAWIYPQTAGESNFGTIMSTPDAASGGWIFSMCSNDATECPSTPNTIELYSYFTGTDAAWYATTGVTLNAWNHVAVIYDADSTSNVPTFFINGREVAAGGPTFGTPTGSHQYALGGPLHTGTASLNGSDFSQFSFDGLIDEVRVYNRALSADEIRRLYNMGR